ncbi:MAG: hypothetical protein AAF990_10510 [Bacteroidota bacterium]
MASQTNNFKLLEEQTIKESPPRAISDIENGVQGQVRAFKITGDTIELYLSRIMDIVIAFLGGEPQRSSDQSMDSNQTTQTNQTPKGDH